MKGKFYTYYEGAIRHEWKYQRGFLAKVDSYLSEISDEWKQDIERQANLINDDEEREVFYEIHRDTHYEFQQYNTILQNSFFTTSYALFEHRLMSICNYAKQRSGSAFSVDDLGSQDYTNKAKIYLEKLGVEFPKKTTEWRKVRIYQRIRNKIMHEGGYVGGSWKYYNDAKSMGIVSGNPCDVVSEQLKLTRHTCEEAAKIFQRFLILVYKAVADM